MVEERQELTTENPQEMAKQQIQQIAEQTKIQKPKIQLIYFRTDQCPHCRRIEGIFYPYVDEHPEIALYKVDATTESGTNRLEAVLKGAREVPTVVVNDKFVVTGDRDFLARLTYAIKLAQNMPPTKEEKTRWLLRR